MIATRRSFLQSMAAMLAAPSLSLANVDYGARKYDFSPWVDNVSMRFDLSKPFDWNGFTIATDGRKLLRVPMVDSVCEPGFRKTPNLQQLPWDTFSNGSWKPFKKHCVALDETTCETCCGIGWIGNPEWRQFDVRTTPECYQRRFVKMMADDFEIYTNEQVIDELNNRIGWTTVDWIGEKMCDQCNGTGTREDGCGMLVDGHIYDAGFVAAISRLGEFEVKLEDYETSGLGGVKEHHKIMLFRGDRFDGLVMPRVSYYV